ncbi:MAG: PLP-dependent aminotransferase family protein [Syntrophomonadaceae bacterium]|nr:PLP-dependent aminotransferase family protein [Syntrophomonadaceae bacterium]MDD3022326.1 PLP-dependent aminotransferase family protein [Syntrophomonadaceae bacterium]
MNDFLDIRLDRDSRTPLYLQIRNAIRDLITEQLLPTGFRLPPERRLAVSIGVNRSTVVKAYEELAAEGLIQSHVGRGTLVAGGNEVQGRDAWKTSLPMRWTHLFNRQAARVNDPLISDLLSQLTQADTINLAAGVPAAEFYPASGFARICSEMLACKPQELLEYSAPQGIIELRSYLARHMRERGASLGSDGILVTSGSQQGLELIARIMVEPGDTVIVEEPSYPGAMQVLRAAGARLVGVPLDNNGIRIDILEQLMHRYRPKLFYTMPAFQNPSGMSMSEGDCRAVLDLSYRYHVPVVEDDAYCEIYFGSQRRPSLFATDVCGAVLYLNTFSKMMFPGLRVGWAAGPPEVIRQMTLLRQLADINTGTLPQAVLAEYCRQGLLANHLAMIREQYRQRRDAALQALSDFAPPGMSWNEPEGGFYIWCHLPPGAGGEMLLRICRNAQVGFVPGEAFFADGNSGSDHIRISYSRCHPAAIRTGVERVCAAVRKLIKEQGNPRSGRQNAEGLAPLAML